MSNLQTYYHFKLDFQNVDQHTGGNWLISCKAWNSRVEYLNILLGNDIKESKGTPPPQKKKINK